MLTKKLSLTEKRIARRLGVSTSDVHLIARTSYGDSYGLYNNYFDVYGVFMGYSKAVIYRSLLRQLISQIGIVNHE